MRYLIDGYNFFFNISDDILPLHKKREQFIQELDQAIQVRHLNAIAIFDSQRDHAHLFPSVRQLKGLEVIFSPKHLCADSYILELLNWNSDHTTLVTSDQKLSTHASYLGARTQTIEAFTHFLLKPYHIGKHRPPTKPQLQESPANMQRLLKVFKQRLQDDENV